MDDILQLPFEGYIRAEIIYDFGDTVEINTEKPDNLESEAGCYRFVVSKEKIK